MKKSILLMVTVAATAGLASATIIYTENANGLTAGSGTLADSTGWNVPAGDHGVLAGGAIFTSNHFDIKSPDANFNFANWDGGGDYTLMTASLDLVDTGASTSVDASLRIAVRRATGSAFYDATAASMADNTIIHYDVVVNTGGTAALYEDGITSIAANTLEIWKDGSMLSSITANGSGDAFSVGLWNRRPDNAMLADNLVFRDTAYAIPEPGTLGLIGAFGGAILFIRRRFKV